GQVLEIDAQRRLLRRAGGLELPDLGSAQPSVQLDAGFTLDVRAHDVERQPWLLLPLAVYGERRVLAGAPSEAARPPAPRAGRTTSAPRPRRGCRHSGSPDHALAGHPLRSEAPVHRATRTGSASPGRSRRDRRRRTTSRRGRSVHSAPPPGRPRAATRTTSV